MSFPRGSKNVFLRLFAIFNKIINILDVLINIINYFNITLNFV